ncbi:MAG: hypothetical protein J0L82_18390 [Deltaproteobacteria bacterium]|nr:hypothetical protein [Deltaproteobacteria bacterium]
MSRVELETALLSFDMVSSKDLQRKVATDLTLLCRSLNHTNLHSSRHIESISKTLSQLSGASASVESQLLQAVQYEESGKAFEATLAIESALRMNPADVEVAHRFKQSLTMLWTALHETAVNDPKAPSISSLYDFLRERGEIGLEGYLFAANHFFQTLQIDRAKQILPALRRLMPNLQFLQELDTIDDRSARESTEPDLTEKIEIVDSRDVAKAVELISVLDAHWAVSQYQEIIDATAAVAQRNSVDTLTNRILYLRTIALSSIGRLDEALSLILKLRLSNPYRVEYLNSQLVICRQLSNYLDDLLMTESSKIDEVTELFEKIKTHGTLNQATYLRLAQWYVNRNSANEATWIFESFLELMPNDPDVLDAILATSESSTLFTVRTVSLENLQRCRRARPFDFRYWSGHLAKILES